MRTDRINYDDIVFYFVNVANDKSFSFYNYY